MHWVFFCDLICGLFLEMFIVCYKRISRSFLLGREDPLEKEMATHSSTLAWKIPWMEEPSRLQSRGHKESDTTERLSFPFLSFTWLSLQQCVQEMHISVLSFPRIFWAYKRNPRINYFQSQVLMLKCFLRQSPTETSYFTVSAGFA